MAVLQSARLRRRVEMATHADFIGRGHWQLRRLADIRGRCRFRVLLPRPVAGFARLAGKAAALIRLHPCMGALLERVEDVLMASAARRRPGIWRCWGRRRRRGYLTVKRPSGQNQPGRQHCLCRIKIAHVPNRPRKRRRFRGTPRNFRRASCCCSRSAMRSEYPHGTRSTPTRMAAPD